MPSRGGLAVVVLAGAGLALPNAPALALTRHGEAAGTAAAMMGAVQFGVGAVAAPLVGVIGTGGVAMGIVVAGGMLARDAVMLLVVSPWLPAEMVAAPRGGSGRGMAPRGRPPWQSDRMAADETRDGVSLTNLDQPLFDGAGATKRDLVDYLDAVADRILPGAARPAAVGDPGAPRPGPVHAEERAQVHAGLGADGRRCGPRRPSARCAYALCNDRRTLLWFANQRAVEYHPTLVRADRCDHATHLVLDLDPPEPATAFAAAVGAALPGPPGARRRRAGRRGEDQRRQGRAHVRAARRRRRRWRTSAAATRAIAARAERLDPALATTAFIREDRGGKVFLDATRAGGATVVAAYSPRVRPGHAGVVPGGLGRPRRRHARRLHRRAPRPACSAAATRGPTRCRRRSALPADLVAEGHTIPVARVQAMHEGKRRKRAQERARRRKESRRRRLSRPAGVLRGSEGQRTPRAMDQQIAQPEAEWHRDTRPRAAPSPRPAAGTAAP